MSDLIPANAGTISYLTRREERFAGRELARLERRGTVALAKLEQDAQLEGAKAQAVGYVGSQAMQAVAMVSQLEGQLGQACPMAVTRLQGVADMTALAIAGVVADAARKIGR